MSAFLLCLQQSTLAVTNDWIHASGSSSWFTTGNWSAGVPTSGDEAFVANGTTAFIEGSTAATADNLFIDDGAVTIGNIDSGSLIVNGQVAVGTAGSSGTLNLSYGSLSVNTLTVGSTGTYTDTSYSTLILTGSDPTIRMANGVNVVINAEIQGTQGLIKSGLGTLTLANDNTYSGGTIITAGTLQVGNGGTSGSLGEGNVANGGVLSFNRSDTITVDNLISGSGLVKQIGNGTTIFTADNTYNGATVISAGTLQIGNGGTSGSLGTGNVTNNATLAFDRSDEIVVNNSITGSGNLKQIGSGTTILTGDNTYTGTTTITNGTLQVGNGGTTGSLGSGNVVNNSALIFDRSDDITVSNSISGTGTLTQAGDGTLIINRDNSYSGITTISAGALQVGDGGTTGSLGTNDIIDDSALIFNRSNSITVNNIISGMGSLTQAGTGDLWLTATNTFSGGTFINNGGTIYLDNNYALGNGNVTVSDGFLRSDVEGVINIGGNYSQSADGTLQLWIGGATTNYNQLKIAGSATLDGVLWLQGYNDYTPSHIDVLTLLHADGGISGSFSDLTNAIDHSPLLTPTLVYTADDVNLTWAQSSFQQFALTSNQRSVAAGLDSIISSSDTNDVQLINYLDNLDDVTNSLPSALSSMSPDQLSSMLVASFAVMDLQGNQFLKHANELHAPYHEIYTTAVASRIGHTNQLYEMVNKPSAFYVEVPANFASIKGNGDSAGFDLSTFGLTLGADRKMTDQLIVGAAGSYLNTSTGLKGGGSMDMNTFAGQLYAVWMRNALHLDGMVGGNLNSFESKRASLGGTASGKTDGLGWTGLIAGGYDWRRGAWTVTPQASLQYMSATVDSFKENGSLAPLSIEGMDAKELESRLGANVRYTYYVDGTCTLISPEVSFAWQHDFINDGLSVTSKFASGNGDGFTVNGPELGSDSIVVGLGVSVQWLPTVNSYINFTSQMGRSGYTSQSLNASVRLSF